MPFKRSAGLHCPCEVLSDVDIHVSEAGWPPHRSPADGEEVKVPHWFLLKIHNYPVSLAVV